MREKRFKINLIMVFEKIRGVGVRREIVEIFKNEDTWRSMSG